MNVDSLGHTTGHWINVFPCSGSYFTTISQKVTYLPKVLKESTFHLLVSPWWAYSQVTEDLKEKKNRLRNKYWLWLNGFKHKHRIVIKIRPHESNDSQLRFMEFMRTPPPLHYHCWFFHHVYCLSLAFFRCVAKNFELRCFFATSFLFSALVERNGIIAPFIINPTDTFFFASWREDR